MLGLENIIKLIIAGSRDLEWVGVDFLAACISKYDLSWDVEEIVSGGARGIDTLADTLAFKTGIPFKLFEADWDKHGKSAGHIRNKAMAEHGDALLLIWDGESNGSSNMKRNMEKLNKPIYEIRVR